MQEDYKYELMEDPKELAGLGLCSEKVYRDLLACQKGGMEESQFKAKYLSKTAILCLDIADFTRTAIAQGELHSLLRILDVQKVCGPVFRGLNARRVRAFADDFTVIFDNPNDALNAAFEVHHRIELFNRSDLAPKNPASCCIGIGYGEVFAIGRDLAMGDEMNQASKLGEDIAKGTETLITERAYEALKERNDCVFQKRTHNRVPFHYYQVSKQK